MSAPGPWRRRYVHDLTFGIDGSGWHEAEMRDSIGFRWSGPGRLSVLRVPAPAGPGRGELHLLLQPNEPIPDIAVFLNGYRLEAAPRRLGPLGVLDIAWDAAAMAGEGRAEFWFQVDRVMQLPAPGERMRGVGFRLSTLALEPAAEGPPAAREALALVAGRRFLAERLPVATGRARVDLRSEGDARLLDLRCEGARLGPSPQPHLALALRAAGGGLELALAAPGMAAVTLALREGAGLGAPAGLSARDALLVARLLAALPQAFGRWVEETAAGVAPDADLLAAWRRDLGRLARAADAMLAAALADGPDPFAGDPAQPFAWPGEG